MPPEPARARGGAHPTGEAMLLHLELKSNQELLREDLLNDVTLMFPSLISGSQVRVLQAVVMEKDVRIQEQIQKHEEELLHLTTQNQKHAELQQVERKHQCSGLESVLLPRPSG